MLKSGSQVTPVSRTSTLPDLAQIFEPIREDLESVEQQFIRHIESRVELIPEIGRYIQTSGGKRIRPALVLMCARLGGYQGEDARLYASVVEFIHKAQEDLARTQGAGKTKDVLYIRNAFVNGSRRQLWEGCGLRLFFV